MSKILYPLLKNEKEIELEEKISSLKSFEEARGMVLTSGSYLLEEFVTWPSVSFDYSAKASYSTLKEFREGLLRRIRNEGIDLFSEEIQEAKAALDRVCIKYFHDVFCQIGIQDSQRKGTHIYPSEASNPQMWKYINYYVIPDIIYWRWGAKKERFSGRRSYSYNMWLRAYHAYPVENWEKITEDTYSAVLERTNLSSYHDIIEDLFTIALRLDNRNKIREYVKALLAISRNVDLLSLDKDSRIELLKRIEKDYC